MTTNPSDSPENQAPPGAPAMNDLDSGRRPVPRRLEEEHTPESVAARLQSAIEHSYLQDFVFGAIDGVVTTFVVVAGVAGAGLSHGVAIILGLVNLISDGFSMAASNYLGTKVEKDLLEKARRIEEQHIDDIPEGEKEEIRQIFAGKGFDGSLLERVVHVITQDRKRWVDTMLMEELGYRMTPRRPLKAAIFTFFAFLSVGAIPLVPYILPHQKDSEYIFSVSAVATGVAFIGIGFLKGYVLKRKMLWCIGETFFVGGFAAAVAYVIGMWVKPFIGEG